MARKKKEEEHENHERWLVSYADFITLLFAFFVVMYSVSSINEGKYRVLSDALVSAFHAPPKSLEPIQVGRPAKSPVLTELEFRSSPSFLITPKQVPKMASQEEGQNKQQSMKVRYDDQAGGSDNVGDKSLSRISDDIALAMSQLVELGLIKIRKNQLWIEIEIKSSILFKSGSAKLKESVIPVLTEIANILSRYPNSIRVEGFTDSQVIRSNIYPSNWELSASRAASVVRLFEMSRIHPERLTAVGYGKNRAIADNSTVEGRIKNRRVVIVVMANNDIARVANRDQSREVDSNNKNTNTVEIDNLRKSGILEEKKLPNDESAGVRLVNDSPSGFYRVPAVNRQVTNKSTSIIAIAPPIRLFRPINLPAINVQNNGH